MQLKKPEPMLPDTRAERLRSVGSRTLLGQQTIEVDILKKQIGL
jgi:hypothetical protein